MKASYQSLSALGRALEGPEPIWLVASAAQVASKASFKKLPPPLGARLEKALARLPEPLKPGARLRMPGAETGDPDVLLSVLPEESSMFELLGFARDGIKEALQRHHPALAICILERKVERKLSECAGAALATRISDMPLYGKRAESRKNYEARELRLFAASNTRADFEHGFATGEGTHLVRYLGALPPNELSTGNYGKRIRELCRKQGIGLKFHSREQLKAMGAGAFTAVDRADPESQGGIYELIYRPKKVRGKNTSPIALVGKGLCFDTGGYDVKISSGMITMKGDMQGSAVALSTLLTAARLGLPWPLKAFLAVTENHISPRGYRADEVVTALNGLAIEVVNTDAEGRMVLADALALASRDKPRMILDFATLTGSAVRAIGTGYSAGFSNREECNEKIRIAGVASGERVWPFPIVKSYAKMLESQIADLKQCVRAGSPDHIMAACFLSRFVGEGIPWVHIDLAAAENEGGLAHTDTHFTGFGVRWALKFLEGQFAR